MIGKIVGIVIAIVVFLGVTNTLGFLNVPIICNVLKSAGINPACSGPIKPDGRDGSSLVFGKVDFYNRCSPEWNNFEAHVYGTVKNDGNLDAKEVTIDATYYRNLIPLSKKTIFIGDLAAGDQKDYDEKFTIASAKFPDAARCEIHYAGNP